MNVNPGRALRRAAVVVVLLWCGAAQAVEVPSENLEGRVLPSLRVNSDALDVAPSLQLDAQRSVLRQARVAPFLHSYGSDWRMTWDTRSNRPNLVQGQGIALLPGRGNALAGVAPESLELEAVEARARVLVESLGSLLDLKGIELRLDHERSAPFGAQRSHWLLEFGQVHEGVPVDGAFVFLRVAHGNVVQFGAERIAAVRVDARSPLSREAAFEAAWRQLGFPAGTRVARQDDAGTLRLYPTLPAGESLGEAYAGVEGAGYGHRLAWRFVFQVEGDPALFQVLFDPHTQEVFDLRDLSVHVDATVRGGVYPTTNTDPVVSVTFPFAAVSNGTAKITDANGVYDYSGGTATVPLDGQYFRMADNCGAISLSNSTDGNIDFGSSAGTDCSTPGFGGAGNTHASRTGFYHLTLINAKARSILTTNTWLNTKVVANMNIQDQCNASWNGQLNFFRSGGGCSNTGEIAAVFLHEWGHGMDTNSGGAASENASGEAVGDTFAFLETRDACIGPNFRPGAPCFNCTTCTGVRDVGEFGLSGPPARTDARPDTITSDTGINCDRFACPYSTPTGFPYRGPMGFQGHCESLIASSANWDLTQSLVARHGEAGWAVMDDIWYSSLVPSKSAFRVASGGQCNAAASVDGCGATNWYPVYLAVDDDDGNLANGTPNACRIWDAFDAHGIACGTRPECTIDSPDFTLAASGSPQRVCAGGTAQYGIYVGANAGFANPVTLSLSGEPAGSLVTFATNPVTPIGTSALSVETPAAAAAGAYALTLSGAALDSPGRSLPLQLLVDAAAPAGPDQVAPANLAIGVAAAPTFSWSAVAEASTYRIDVATDAAFTQIVASASGITGTSWTSPALANGTHHYWRVFADNTCGESLASATFSFTTGASAQFCRTPNLAIPDNNTTGITDTLVVSDPASFTRLRLRLRANHTWVGDVVATLSRGATSVTPYDRPGVPASTFGCGGDNIDVMLDDTATTPLESTCGGSPPAISGVLAPNAPLAAFAAGPIAGTWALNVSDRVSSDTGTLLEWCLDATSVVPAFSVGGSVSGLTGSGLVLALDVGSESLEIDADGAFAFLTRLHDGESYSVSIASQPGSSTCVVENGNGTIAGADAGNVLVTCGGPTFSVGGTVSGLQGDGLVLALNGQPQPALSGDGSFVLDPALDDGDSYAVTVVTQPTDPSQTCSVANGSGVIAGADVSDVAVTCVTDQFEVGGVVSGLLGSGLRLSLNGGEELVVAGNGDFVFATPVTDGQAYAVSIVAQPSGPNQQCVVEAGAGSVNGAAVDDVSVTCTTLRYRVGGALSGLEGGDLELRINAAESLVLDANGPFQFPTALDDGSPYTIEVLRQPSLPAQVCSVEQGSGSLSGADVAATLVSCVRLPDAIFAHGFEDTAPAR